jgi:hypothetical protein
MLQVRHGESCQFIQRKPLAQDQATRDAKDIYERFEAAIGAGFEEEEGRHIALTDCIIAGAPDRTTATRVFYTRR